MSGPPEPESQASRNGNGNGRRGNGRHGLLAGISDKLIRALPPAFLLLVLLNIAFLGTTMWLVQQNADQRNAMLTKIVEGCLTNAPR